MEMCVKKFVSDGWVKNETILEVMVTGLMEEAGK